MTSPGPAQLIVGGGLLQAVSQDETQLAYLPSPASVNGVLAGTLLVSPLPPLPSTTNMSLANNAWAAFFSGPNNVLVYLTGPTASIDAGSTAVYGALNLWTPGMSTGIKLSTGFVPIRTGALDNSWLLYWDTAMPSNQGTGNVMLARVADCTPNTCAPLSLAAGVTAINAAASPDGNYAAFAVKNAGPPVTFDVYLVNISSGKATRIAAATNSGSLNFSPDSTLLAC
jgi:hypothetical protein